MACERVARVESNASASDFATAGGSAAGAFPSPKKKATLFADIVTATGANPAGAILKYVGLPVPGREETASGDQIVDPNE